MMGFVTLFWTTPPSTASFWGSNSKGEVWSLLSALEVPYTPEKLYLPKSYMDYHTKKNLCDPPY